MSIIEKKSVSAPAAPPAGYVHWFVDSLGRPSYVDELGQLHTFAGATGSTGPTGPTGAQGPQGETLSFADSFRGAWSPATTYHVGDVVQTQGSLFLASGTTTGQDPMSDESGSAWSVIYDQGQ